MGKSTTSRRDFLSRSCLTLGQGLLASSAAWGRPTSSRPLRVAAIFTVLRFRSHAYNILENFLGPYYFRGKLTDPGVEVVSFYADQFPEGDMARDVARRFGIPLYESIEQALCVGKNELAVDAVLAIGEHGDYPFNARGQQMYPRKRFFDESLAVMKRSGKYVPYFNDKHLSYRWDWAQTMYETCRRHQMPLIAGSSVPLAQRIPPIDIPRGSQIEEAVCIHGGGLESYDFHALELLQSFVESRSGGETGIASLQLLWGESLEAARRAGRWSTDLVEAAMKAETSMSTQRQQYPRVQGKTASKAKARKRPGQISGPHAICITYQDGLKATVLRIGHDANRWNFACRLKGEDQLVSTAIFNSPWGNRGLFKALSHAIQQTFLTGQEPYPAERTLLTTGAVAATMRSYERRGAVIETPELSIAYKASDWSMMRENGDTWKILTKDVPQPTEFAPRSWDELK